MRSVYLAMIQTSDTRGDAFNVWKQTFSSHWCEAKIKNELRDRTPKKDIVYIVYIYWTQMYLNIYALSLYQTVTAYQDERSYDSRRWLTDPWESFRNQFSPFHQCRITLDSKHYIDSSYSITYTWVMFDILVFSYFIKSVGNFFFFFFPTNYLFLSLSRKLSLTQTKNKKIKINNCNNNKRFGFVLGICTTSVINQIDGVIRWQTCLT